MKRAILVLWLMTAAGVGKCQAQALLGGPLAEDAQNSCGPNADRPLTAACDWTGTAKAPNWASAEYLLWWVQRGPTPPLVVTGSPSDPFPGALDQPGTRVLFGNDGLDYGAMSGLRLNFGMWLDQDGKFGVEASGFVLFQQSASFHAQADANGQPFLATPFVDALTGKDNVYFISQNFANPGLSAHLTGSVGVDSTTNLWSWELQGVANLARSATYSLDALLGFREVSLCEDLNYTTSVTNLTAAGASTFLATPVPPGFVVTTNDRFATTNLFNGGQAGLRFTRTWGVLSLEAVGKIAIGDMHETASIGGQTTTSAAFPVTQVPGGIFAQTSNIGTYHRDVFAFVPEVGLNACVQITPALKARVGYTFLYLSDVARPGDQIDPVLNIHRVPIDSTFGTPGGPNRPAFDMHGSSFWAQGINLGLEFDF